MNDKRLAFVVLIIGLLLLACSEAGVPLPSPLPFEPSPTAMLVPTLSTQDTSPGAVTPPTDAAALLFPGGLPVVRIGDENLQTDTFLVMESALVDVGNDLAPEQAIAYHVHRGFADRASLYQYDGATGVALFSNDGQTVLWQSPLYSTQSLGLTVEELQITLTVQPLQAGVAGLYWTHGGRIAGSGGYTTVTGQLLRWDGSQFVTVWEADVSSYGQMGDDFGGGSDLTVTFEDVDQDGTVELLTSAVVSARSLEGATTAPDYDYTLHFPGALIYRWDGQQYTLYAIRSDYGSTRLRPAEPVFYAPRARAPIQLDGDLTDFFTAAEYGEGMRVQASNGSSGSYYWGHARFLWDESYFYVGVEIHDDRLVQVSRGDQLYRGDHVEMWFDIDLAGDFNEASINQDDIQIGLSPGNFSTTQPEAVIWFPPNLSWRSSEIQLTAVQAEGEYHIEARIPLSLLGLDGANLVTGEGTTAEIPGSGENPGHEYWLAAGRVIGFGFMFSDTDTPGATQQENVYVTPESMRWAEPLTWGNLVFVAAP